MASLCPFVSVPDQVSILSMSIDNSNLRLSWSPPRGDWDNYSILLKDGSAVLMNQTISKQSKELLQPIQSLGLVPGHLYFADVIVNSGSLSNTAHCSSRLGQLPLQHSFDLCFIQPLSIPSSLCMVFRWLLSVPVGKMPVIPLTSPHCREIGTHRRNYLA